MSLAQIVYDFKELDFQTEYDPLTTGTDVVKSKIRPDFTGGVLWYGSKYIVGFSVNYRFKNEAKDHLDIKLDSDQHYYLFANYSFPFFDDKLILTPNVLSIFSSDSKYQLETGIRLRVREIASFGVSHRTDKSVVLMAGVKFLKMFELNYAYDFSYGNIGEEYIQSSHEIMLTCRIRKLADAFKKPEDKKLRSYYWQ